MRMIITYDVTDSNSRVKIANVLSSVGERLEKSVFLCDADSTMFAGVLRKAQTLLDPSTDSLHVFPQCPKCEADAQTLGRAHIPERSECWVL
jgi:CRISPR-associated protein Cas2